MQSFRVPTLALISISGVVVLLLAGCGGGDSETPAASLSSPVESTPTDTSEDSLGVPDPVQVVAGGASTETPAQPVKANVHPEVVISTEFGKIRVRLDAEKAPLTTENFLSNYVERGFYSGTVFHCVDKDSMIVGGGYGPDLKGRETRAYLKNEANNGLKNERGTIAMTRWPTHIDTATSQFYINLVNNPSLDHKDRESAENFGYCVFGEVVDGMDVVDKIAEVPVTDKGDFPKTPVEPVIIQSIELVR
jgi:cyclophilin family peptidyl-prolyl cis-trans isomerase